MEIKKDTSLEAWKQTLKTIMEKGQSIIDEEKRQSKEILNIIIKIRHPEQDITTPIEIMRSLKKWVYPDLEELRDVFFKKEASSLYYYTYGARIFNYSHNLDQVEEYVIPLLKKDPSTRRAAIILYHPVIDSKITMKENPSLVAIFFKIRKNKLDTTTVLRSNDMFIGWPANIYQVYLLQKYIASQLGIETGNITTISHSAHIFEEYKKEVEEILRE